MKFWGLLFLLLIVGSETTSIVQETQTANIQRKKIEAASFVTAITSMLTNFLQTEKSSPKLGLQNNLELDSNIYEPNKKYFVDEIYVWLTGPGALTSAVMTFFLYGIIFLAGFTIIIGIFLMFSTEKSEKVLRDKAAKGHNLQAFCFWSTWLILGYFTILVSLTISSWNHTIASLTQNLLSLESIRKIVNDALKLYDPSFTLDSVSFSYSSHNSTTKSKSSTTTDVFCSLAWSPESSHLNQYPSNTPIFDYNRRRLALYNSTDNADLEYVKLLLADPSYPNSAGGITTRMARSFGGISNECEQFHGDMSKCCSKTSCESYPSTEDCLKDRCPGRVLAEKGGSGHCECIYEMLNMGFDLEPNAAFLCTYQLVDKIGSKLATYTQSKISKIEFDENGCEGQYFAQDASLRGPLELQTYVPHNSVLSNSTYQYLTQTKSSQSAIQISWVLDNCVESDYQISFHFENTGAEKTLTVNVDSDISVPVVFVARVGWSIVSVQVERVPIGFHTVSLTGTQDQVPNIHYLEFKKISQ